MEATGILEAEDRPNRFCFGHAIVELFFDRTKIELSESDFYSRSQSWMKIQLLYSVN